MPAIKWHISHHFQNIVSVVTHSAYSNGRKKGKTKHKHKNIHKRTRTHMHSEMHAHLECTDLKSLTHSLLFHLREHLQQYSDQQSYNMINLFTVSLTVSERAKDFMPPLQLLHLETFLFFPCPFTGFSLWLSW